MAGSASLLLMKANNGQTEMENLKGRRQESRQAESLSTISKEIEIYF